MSAIITLTDEQREAITQHGTPLPVFDDDTRATYVLLSVRTTTAAADGYRASTPGIAAYGEGETAHEATFALMEALRQYIAACG